MVTYDKNIFAANLKTQMTAHGMNQSDIARLLGVSRATVSAYCKGEQMPRMDKLEQLSRHFGISTSALIEAPAPVNLSSSPSVILSAAKNLIKQDSSVTPFPQNDRARKMSLRSQCAHWLWQSVIPRRKRIATSLRSSQ